MSAGKANPLAYILPALAFGAALLYYGYGAVNSMGLSSSTMDARVTGKQYTPGSTTYNTNVAGGRSWTQSVRNEDAYVVTLDVGGTPTSALVSKELYQSLNTNDPVRVQVQYTRISKRMLVVSVMR